MTVAERPDGTLVIEPLARLQSFVPNLPAVLAQQAVERPDQPYLVQRQTPTDEWVAASYGSIYRASAAVAQWLLRQGIDRGRSMLILSGNSILHAVFKYGAMVSVNYSLMPSQNGDYGRLNHVVGLLKPAIVFAEQTDQFADALEAVDFGEAIVVTTDPGQLRRRAVSIEEVLLTETGPVVAASIRTIDPDAPAAFMLTSGSTSLPKAVIQTQRMITSNLAQGQQVLGDAAGWDEVMLDWLPWNHVSGAFTQMGVLVSGGTLLKQDWRTKGGRPAGCPPDGGVGADELAVAGSAEADHDVVRRVHRDQRLAAG